ncbi:MAG: 3-dehydroquinate dehydratase [Candidatus Eisenbacteria bacterium]|uniref:3-dehydroquinate dehydratase n=1 Tax=Eiseniibacteriota bacterium TaxID=2212470 RepID=A0A956LXT4_UNCEI|nr:3-dehydroquinate dehydratase [Candidatus Eisenbacteria bacterium]
MKRVLVIHGPNLDQLGVREPETYGSETLEDLDEAVRKAGAGFGLDVESFQSNHEGAIIDRLHGAGPSGILGILLNPGGLAHTSVCLRDAIASTRIPVIEVHLSNTLSREEFRRRHLTAPACRGMIIGLGRVSYIAGLLALNELIADKD